MSASSLPPYEELDHTADLALRINGLSSRDLFRNATLGLGSLLCTETADEPDIGLEISVESDDSAALVVDWLNELLYLSDLHQRIWKVSEIVEMDSTLVRAHVQGFVCRQSSHAIKAATYHNVELRRDEQGLAITITFDV